MEWTDEEKRGAVVGYLFQRFQALLVLPSLEGESHRDTLERKALEVEELRYSASLAKLPASYDIFSEYEQAYRSRIAYGDEGSVRREGETELIFLRRKELVVKDRKDAWDRSERLELSEKYQEHQERIQKRIEEIKQVDLLKELEGIKEACDRDHNKESAYFWAFWEYLYQLQKGIVQGTGSKATEDLRLLKKAIMKAWEETEGNQPLS